MELPGSGQYADKANKVPTDGGASSSAAFGSFVRKLITLAAGGAAAAAGGAAGAAGGAGAGAEAAAGGPAVGSQLGMSATAMPPSLAAAGPSAAAWGEAAGAGSGPMMGLGGMGAGAGMSDALMASATAAPAAAAQPGLGSTALRGFMQGGTGGALRGVAQHYMGQVPADSAFSGIAQGVARSGNLAGGVQGMFMDPNAAPVVGGYNPFDLMNMGLSSRRRRRY